MRIKNNPIKYRTYTIESSYGQMWQIDKKWFGFWFHYDTIVAADLNEVSRRLADHLREKQKRVIAFNFDKKGRFVS